MRYFLSRLVPLALVAGIALLVTGWLLATTLAPSSMDGTDAARQLDA